MDSQPTVCEVQPNNTGNKLVSNQTLFVAILDASGSMECRRHQVISGYNDFLESQRSNSQIQDELTVSTITFNSNVKVLHQPTKVNEVPFLTTSTYIAQGSTALYDAIKFGIDKASEYDTEDSNKNNRIVIYIYTDGEDNVSRFTKADIDRLICEKEARGNWTFMYVGVEPSKWITGAAGSKRSGNVVHATNPEKDFADVADGITKFRSQSNVRQQKQGMLSQP